MAVKKNTGEKKEVNKKEGQDELEALLESVRTKYGEESIMRLGDAGKSDVGSISTGALSLDIALGIGGLPKGRIVEIFGPEGSGKTTLALTVVAEAQKAGGVAAFIDAEHALDPEYSKRIGVNIKDLLVSQPNSGEEALAILDSLARSGSVDIVVVDSVAALTPRAEIEGEVGDQFIGLQARMMSQALRRLATVASKSGTTVVFINQLREKIGVMFGSPETTPGGRALKFYSSVRIDIRRIAQIKKGDKIMGHRTRVKVVKNKVASPFRITELDIYYGEGFSHEGDVLNTAVARDIVKRSGASYSFGEVKLGVGVDNARKRLQEDKRLLNEIKKAVVKSAKEAESAE